MYICHLLSCKHDVNQIFGLITYILGIISELTQILRVVYVPYFIFYCFS
jgi:hypothetical protein